MRTGEDSKREDERTQYADEHDLSEFRMMPQVTPMASAPSGWRSVAFTIVAWSLVGWAMIAAVLWLGAREELFSAKKPSAAYQSR